MNHVGTYIRTYVRTSHLEGSHPTLKIIKQKMSKIIQVNVPNTFILPKYMCMYFTNQISVIDRGLIDW